MLKREKDSLKRELLNLKLNIIESRPFESIFNLCKSLNGPSLNQSEKVFNLNADQNFGKNLLLISNSKILL